MNEKSEYLKIEYDGVRYYVQKRYLVALTLKPETYPIDTNLMQVSDYAIRIRDNILIKAKSTLSDIIDNYCGIVYK